MERIKGKSCRDTDEFQSVKLLQIVGFKNSGKTTLAEKLLRFASELGLKTAAVKHHGHGGIPELPSPRTDSVRLFEAGAGSSLVFGGGVILLQSRALAGGSVDNPANEPAGKPADKSPENSGSNPVDKPIDNPADEPAGKPVDDLANKSPNQSGGLDCLIRLATICTEPDLIVIEGFKEAEYDKIVLVRTEEDWENLRKLANVRLVLVRDGELAERLLTGDRIDEPGEWVLVSGELGERLLARPTSPMGLTGSTQPSGPMGTLKSTRPSGPMGTTESTRPTGSMWSIRSGGSLIRQNIPGTLIPLLIREDNESIAVWFADWLKEEARRRHR